MHISSHSTVTFYITCGTFLQSWIEVPRTRLHAASSVYIWHPLNKLAASALFLKDLSPYIDLLPGTTAMQATNSYMFAILWVFDECRRDLFAYIQQIRLEMLKMFRSMQHLNTLRYLTQILDQTNVFPFSLVQVEIRQISSGLPNEDGV